MATANLYRDERNKLSNKNCPLYIVVGHKSKIARIPLKMCATDEEWEEIVCPETGKILFKGFTRQKEGYKALNNDLQLRLAEVRNFIYELEKSGKIRLYDVFAIRDEYQAQKMDVCSSSTFTDFIKKHRDSFEKKHTIDKYNTAWRRIVDFVRWKRAAGEEKDRIKTELTLKPKTKCLPSPWKIQTPILFEEITAGWLKEFDSFLAETTTPSVNGRRPILNCIRSVFNAALKAKVISQDIYPFSSFSVKKEKTRKRNIGLEGMIKIMNYKSNDARMMMARDYFMLSFYLIGINPIDMYAVENTDNEYICYQRSKTGRTYSIKLNRVAMEIINRNRGKEKLLSWCEHHNSYDSFYSYMYNLLKRFGKEVGIPGLTQYYSRHTWATLAQKAGISKDIIACALGHDEESDDVTWGYIDFRQSQIDEANNVVINYMHSDIQKEVHAIKPQEVKLLKEMGFDVLSIGKLNIIRSA